MTSTIIKSKCNIQWYISNGELVDGTHDMANWTWSFSGSVTSTSNTICPIYDDMLDTVVVSEN